MRHTARALVGVLLVAWCCCQSVVVAESRWWPFGGSSDTEVSAPATAPTTTRPSAPTLAAVPTTTAPSTAAPFTKLPQQAALPPYSASAAEPEPNWMFQSPLAKVSWPRLHMPEVSLPKPHLPRPQFWPKKSEVQEARNGWVQKSPDPNHPSPLQAVKDGAHRVGQSTRTAWRKTVDALTPGDSSTTPSSRVAQHDIQPPFWKRMFTAEEPQPQGPQTVTEWMAQERLDP